MLSPPSWTGCGPPGLDSFSSIFINSKNILREVSGHSVKAILLKTASVRVSSIQIMQIRVQNKGKRVWESRYDGDISTPPSLNLCLSSSNSVDKLKVIKKNFYKLCLSCCCKYVKPAFKFSAKIMTNYFRNNA